VVDLRVCTRRATYMGRRLGVDSDPFLAGQVLTLFDVSSPLHAGGSPVAFVVQRPSAVLD
jgi:hypothetical protein